MRNKNLFFTVRKFIYCCNDLTLTAVKRPVFQVPHVVTK